MDRNFLRLTAIFFIALAGPIFSSDVTIDMNTQWNKEFSALIDGIQVADATKKSVLRTLAKWEPEQCGMVWQLPMQVRDLYLHDETVRNLLRGSFFPGFMGRCAGRLGFDFSGVNLDVLYNAPSAGLVILKNVHKIPYMICAVKDQDCSEFFNAIDLQDCVKSACAVMGHACAIGASVTGNPVLVAGALACTGGTMMLADQGDFAEVILRHLKRNYDKKGNVEKLALIEHMIARRRIMKANKAKNM